MASSLEETKELLSVRDVLLKHGYKLLYPTITRQNVRVYHCSRINDNLNNGRLFKVEHYLNAKQCPASLNHKGLCHKNLLPYIDHFEDGDYVFYSSDITRPSAGRFLEMLHLDIHQQEHLVRKWTTQLVDVLNYCHTVSLYLTDFHWDDTVIDIGNSNLLLNAFDGMTNLLINELTLGPHWKLPPEVERHTDPKLHPRIEKIEAWTLGVAILDLLARNRISMSIEKWWQSFKSDLTFLSASLETLDLSSDAQSFLLCLLHPKSTARYSIKMVGNHPWLTATDIPRDVYYDVGSKQLQMVLDKTEKSDRVATKDLDDKTDPVRLSKPSDIGCPSHQENSQSLQKPSPNPATDSEIKNEQNKLKLRCNNEARQDDFLPLGPVIKTLPVGTTDGNSPQSIAIILQHEKSSSPTEGSVCSSLPKAQGGDGEKQCDHDKEQTPSHFVGDSLDDREGFSESEEEFETQEDRTPKAITAWACGMSLAILLILWDKFYMSFYDP